MRVHFLQYWLISMAVLQINLNRKKEKKEETKWVRSGKRVDSPRKNENVTKFINVLIDEVHKVHSEERRHRWSQSRDDSYHDVKRQKWCVYQPPILDFWDFTGSLDSRVECLSTWRQEMKVRTVRSRKRTDRSITTKVFSEQNEDTEKRKNSSKRRENGCVYENIWN